MKRKHNEGFTLVELLISMVILAAIVLPTCTSLVLSYRMNAKTEKMMQAQLAVSSTVETLMAEGIDANRAAAVIQNSDGVYDFAWDSEKSKIDDYPGVEIIVAAGDENGAYYSVTVTDDEKLVTVTTHIRKGGSGS